MRVLFLLLCAALLGGQTLSPTLDDAVRTLARNIAAQLAPNEVAQLNERSPDPAFAAETARARTLLDRALRRPAPRGAAVVEVVVSAAASIRGPVLVAEIRKGPEPAVETVEYRAQPAAAAPRVMLQSRKLWEQEEPILDLAPVGGGVAVLSPSGIKLCRGNSCDVKQALEPAPARDPRGRLLVSGDMLTAFLPANGSDFQLDGEPVHFTPGQNVLETADGQKFYSIARVGAYRLVADLDGHVHVSQGQQKFVLAGWGGDVVALPSVCNAGALVLAASPSEGDAPDSITVYELTGQSARAAGDPLPFAGPVTALWPASGGALAVVRQAGRYAAYSLTLDCSR